MGSEQHEAVISGIAGKFPECASVDEFKEKLFSKSVLIKPDEKANTFTWDKEVFSRGHLDDFNRFDNQLFGVPTSLMKHLDPMFSACMEKTFEAILDAGLNPHALRGHNVGVFAAPSQSDLESLDITSGDKHFIDGQGMVGQGRCMMANRISFSFNFTGPSYSMEASWVAGKQCLDIAVDMVSSGILEAAVIASASLLYCTLFDNHMRELGVLTSDGLCQPFDAEAHGAARSEGVVVFIIQRRENAKRIYGTVKKSKTILAGKKSCGFIKLDPYIETCLKDFYTDINERPEDVSYIEAHGVSTKDTDAKELNALASVFCSHKKTSQLIGSITGNVGLTDACTGLVAMVKAILVLETGVIPPTVNYRIPNPEVPALLSGDLKPVTESMDLPGDLVAVNTLSVAGAVSHTLLKRHDKVKRTLTGQELPEDGLPRLVLLQARHEQGARAVCDKVSSMAVDVEFVSMVNDAFKTPIPSYLWRGYSVIPTVEEQPVSNTKEYDPRERPLWFVFSGMGSQWNGMGKELLKIPLFHSSIEKCAKLLQPKGLDLLHILTTDETSTFDNILNCMVGITAVQIGLVEILRELGITPNGIIGHSIGELGCAYADGCLTAEQTIMAAYSRGKASLDSLDNDYIKGSMAAVGLGHENVKDRLPPSIDIACHNSNESCTLSGPTEDIVSFVEELKSKGVFARAVSAGGIAYHSRYIRDVAPKLLESLKKVNKSKETDPEPKPRSSKWICTSVPESQWDTQDAKFCSPEYHTNNLLNPVYFQEGFQHVPSNAILLEIAPHGLLQAILRRAVGPDAVNLALTNRAAKSNLGHLLKCFGELYINGISYDVNALYPKVEYPVSRGTPSLSTLATWDHDFIHFGDSMNLIAKVSRKNRFTVTTNLSPTNSEYLLWRDHCIGRKVVLSPSQILIYPWQKILSWKFQEINQRYTILKDVIIRGTVAVDETECKLQSSFSPATFNFEVFLETDGLSQKTIILTGKLVETEDEPKPFTSSCGKEDPSSMEVISKKEIYLILSELGCDLGPQFQLINKLRFGIKESVALVKWNGNWITFLDSLIKIAVIFESRGQGTLMDVKYFQQLSVDGKLLSSLPIGTELEVLYQSWCHRLVCQGVELNGVALGPLTASDTAPLAWAESRFQPYFVDDLTAEEFWSCSFETATEDMFGNRREGPCMVNVLVLSSDDSSSSRYTQLLGRNFRNWQKLELKISTVDVEGARQQVGEMHGKAVVVVGEQSAVASLLSLCHDTDHLYCLKISVVDVEGARQQVGEMHGKAVVVVGEQSAVASLLNLCHDADHLYCVSHINKGAPQLDRVLKPIYKCQTESGPLVFHKKVNNKGDFSVYKSDSLDWLSGFKNFVGANANNSQTIVFATHKLTPRQVLPALSNEAFAKKIRTVFIQDDDAPPFSLSTSLYSSQLALGLSVNILSEGSWGSLRTLSLPVGPCTVNANNLVSSAVKDLRMTCVGLNTRFITFKQKPSTKEPELSWVDYSGTLRDQRVMGVAYLQPESNSVLPDSVLQWPVPAGWTLEDAATVPVIYSLAYYCISHVVNVDKEKTVLVHAGMSLIGQAVISVALDAGARIIASVADQQEASQLVKLFPAVKATDVFVLGKENITLAVKQRTKGKGVEIIFNCLRGSDFEKTLKTVNMFCRIIYLSEIKSDKREITGLGNFFNNVSVSGITLDSIKMSSNECRTEIKQALENGIIKGVVKPLAKRTFSLPELPDALRNLKTNNITVKTVLTSTNVSETKLPAGYKENKFGNLQIIAGENEKLKLTLTEQLIREGASQIILLISEEYKKSFHMKKINDILQRKKTCIITSSPSCLDSVESASKFLEESLHIGEVSSVFCVCMDENGSRMKNLDSASRRILPGLQQFVSLLGRGTAVCDSRASSGLPVCSIRGEASTDAAKVVPYLPGLLADAQTSTSIYDVADSCGRHESKDEEDPLSFLPGKVEELFLIGEYEEFHPRFVEQTTLSPPYSAVKRNVLPLFVIPGLGELSIQPLLRRLMYPTFCCRLPVEIPPVQELAEILVQDIVNIQEQGPYNVIGESWGGALALSVARLLEVYGHEVNLILVQGVPATTQATLRSLCGRFGAADPGTCIINAALNNQSEVVKHAAWRERLSELLLTLEPDIREPVSRAVTALNNQLSLLLNFKFSNQLFSGNVILISSKCGLSNSLQNIYTYCQRPHQVVTLDVTDHRLLLANDVTVTAVNDNMACFH